MAIDVGTDKISSDQSHLLNRIRNDSSLKSVVETLMFVLRDEEICSGKEQLHPEWLDYWEKYKNKICNLIGNDILSEIDQNIASVSEFDTGVKFIDPSKSKICFLLGAGASKPEPSEIPTVKELLPDLLTRARRLDREEVTKLADFCKRSHIDNIEDLLTAAQMAEFCGRNPTILKLIEFLIFHEETGEPGIRKSRRALVDVSSIAFLQDTLQVLFGLLSSRMLPAEPNDGHKAIAGYVGKHADSRIVTTNYDCCMDRALSEQNVSFIYHLDFANAHHLPAITGTPISLVKLHGSLNWFYCDTCQEVHWIDIQQTVEDYIDDRISYPVIGLCRNCGGQRRGLLVPPLAMKFDLAPPLHPLIGKATDAFSEVDLIVVVGFSFAEADLYISRMVNKTIQEIDRAQLVIFDPDSAVKEKVRRKFAARIPDFKSSRILWVRGDCSKTLPKFLAGDFYHPELKEENSEAVHENILIELSNT